MKIHKVYSLLLIPTVYTINASNLNLFKKSNESHHSFASDRSYARSYNSLSGGPSVPLDFNQEEKNQIKEKIKSELQPIANVILHRPIVQDKIYQHFPASTLHKIFVDDLLPAIKGRCIKEVASKLIKLHPGYCDNPAELNSCAMELKEYAIKKSPLFSFGIPKIIPANITEIIDAIPFDSYSTMWPEFCSILESSWEGMAHKHKKDSYEIMLKLYRRYHPHENPEEKNLRDMFETNYAFFKEVHDSAKK